MTIANAHNLPHPLPESRPFGLRVSTRPGDPFRLLVGSAWNREHWYATAAERDSAADDMSRQHDYSRQGDTPALVFEKIDR